MGKRCDGKQRVNPTTGVLQVNVIIVNGLIIPSQGRGRISNGAVI